jgi:hypothetical protein
MQASYIIRSVTVVTERRERAGTPVLVRRRGAQHSR